MSASLNKLRQDCDDDLISVFINQCAIMEATLREIGVEPTNMPMRPNYDHFLTPLARFEASAEHLKGLHDAANKQSMGCTKLIDELTTAIQSVVKAPLPNINKETINDLSEAECKTALGLAVKTMFYQAKQMHILIGENSAGEHLVKLFKQQRYQFEKHAEEVEEELQRHSGKKDQISALEEDVAKRSSEVRDLRVFMKTLSKRLQKVTIGSPTLPKELRKCEKVAMESSVEKIISVVQMERETTKELRAKLREADAEKQELQMVDKQLYDHMEDLRRQLNEAVAENAEKESEFEELMEKRIRCSVCMDREKDTVFVCGHAYCSECASEWRKCTVCVTEKCNRPITFKHPLFL